MSKSKQKMEFRYYDIPAGEYVLPKIGDEWEFEYGVGYHDLLHFHNYMEIGFCYHGAGTLVLGEQTYRYEGDQFSIIPANKPHTTYSDEGHIDKWEYLFIDMDEYIRNEMHSDHLSVDEIVRIVNKRQIFLSLADNPRLYHLIRTMIEECRAENLYYRESLKGYLQSFVIELLRLDEEEVRAKQSIKQTKYLEGAIQYVHAHYMDDLKAQDLANICGLSESHFRRIFEESMNMKPMDFVNMIRIRQACNIIQKQDLSMEEIGYKVGYQNVSTFNRNFKRIIGMSPYQWKIKIEKTEGNLVTFNISAKRGWESQDI